jgi:preprotein translocase subunit YajC
LESQSNIYITERRVIVIIIVVVFYIVARNVARRGKNRKKTHFSLGNLKGSKPERK